MLFSIDFAVQIIWLWCTLKGLGALPFRLIMTKHTECFAKLQTMHDGICCDNVVNKAVREHDTKLYFHHNYRMTLKTALMILDIRKMGKWLWMLHKCVKKRDRNMRNCLCVEWEKQKRQCGLVEKESSLYVFSQFTHASTMLVFSFHSLENYLVL